MANPNKQDSITADRDGNPLLSTAQTLVADSAQTAVPVAVTFTANAPTAGDTQTIADGTVPTVAELGQWVANSEDFMAEVDVDLTVLVTKVNAIFDILEAHGLMLDA